MMSVFLGLAAIAICASILGLTAAFWIRKERIEVKLRKVASTARPDQEAFAFKEHELVAAGNGR